MTVKPETIFGRSKEITFIVITLNDVARRTNTTLDVLLESRIDDYWNVDGYRNLSERCTGFTQFI